MKKFFMGAIALMIATLFSCTQTGTEANSKKVAVAKKIEPAKPLPDPYFSRDSAVFAGVYAPKKFNAADYHRVFFVKNWNTPDFYPDGQWTGCAWDGDAFLGAEYGDSVYYLYHYSACSKEFAGKSTIIERKFPRNGVVRDPRNTCWWLSCMNDSEFRTDLTKPSKFIGLDLFLAKAARIDTQAELQSYLQWLKHDILITPGLTIKEKIVNYTKLCVPGDPKTWDAWKWPGYYVD